jgi:hypothetical protein
MVHESLQIPIVVFLSAGVLTRRNNDWHKCSALRVPWGFKELPTVRKEAKETGT